MSMFNLYGEVVKDCIVLCDVRFGHFSSGTIGLDQDYEGQSAARKNAEMSINKIYKYRLVGWHLGRRSARRSQCRPGASCSKPV